jgi:hypothetical protein
MSKIPTIMLFRPLGEQEYQLVRASGFQRFPPRLNFQPIFYPVLDHDYAVQIARDWNTQDPNSGYVGYVARFHVDAGYLSHFQVRTAGSSSHREYWIPAAEVDEFNRHIVGSIEIVQEFHSRHAS